MAAQDTLEKPIEELESVVIRLAGDSGDGMQLTGGQFTRTAALFGNDISTLPDFPAEIRAPAGSLPGVSSFQLNFSSRDIYTPGDAPQVLVAMNPAGLKTNIGDLEDGGILLVNTDAFTKANLNKAGYKSNPLEDGSLSRYRVFKVPITSLNAKALEGLEMSARQIERCKNFWALGLLYWLYNRATEPTLRFLERRFKDRAIFYEANKRALLAGYNYGDTTEIFTTAYRVRKAQPAGGQIPQYYRGRGRGHGLCDGGTSVRQTPLLHRLSHYARRAKFCMRSRNINTLASKPSRRKTKSPRCAPRSGRPLGAISA